MQVLGILDYFLNQLSVGVSNGFVVKKVVIRPFKKQVREVMDTKILTSAQVKEKFHTQGITVKAWAQKNGFDPQYVYAILNGRMKARFGTAHEIAVALGMKSVSN